LQIFNLKDLSRITVYEIAPFNSTFRIFVNVKFLPPSPARIGGEPKSEARPPREIGTMYTDQGNRHMKDDDDDSKNDWDCKMDANINTYMSTPPP